MHDPIFMNDEFDVESQISILCNKKEGWRIEKAAMGIEPMTFSLQDWRSTTKLRCPAILANNDDYQEKKKNKNIKSNTRC